MNFQDASNLRIPEGYVRTIHDKNSRLLWGSVGYDVSFDGDSYQQAYSGKNLLPFTNQNYTLSGVRVYAQDGELYLDGTATANVSSNANYWKTSLAFTLPAGTYTLGASEYTFAQGEQFWMHDENQADLAVLKSTTGRTATFTLATDTNVYLGIFWANGNVFNNKKISITLNSGSTAQPYERYVGGIPAPNPEFPQEIKTVTGEQTVKVTGKNLFNITPRKTGDGYYNNNAGSYVDNSYDDSLVTYETTENGVTATILTAWKGLFFASTPLKAGTQYHFKWNATSTGNVRASVYTLDSSFKIVRRIGNYTANPTSSDANITLQDGEVCIGLWVGSNNANDVLTISQPQIELGGQATSYEAFTGQDFPIDLGSIELAKIGAYTDGITRVGTKWYIEKQVGKMVLDGSNSGITWARSTVGSNYAFWFRNNMTDALTNAHKKICDKFTYSNKSFLGAPSPSLCENSESYGPAAYMFIFKVPSSLATTIADWTTWLASNPTTVYYALATPTTTEITDATLIAQLEAVYDWVRRHGYNASVTGNLPIVINRTALPTA